MMFFVLFIACGYAQTIDLVNQGVDTPENEFPVEDPVPIYGTDFEDVFEDFEDFDIIGKDETTPDTIVEEELVGKDETTDIVAEDPIQTAGTVVEEDFFELEPRNVQSNPDEKIEETPVQDVLVEFKDAPEEEFIDLDELVGKDGDVETRELGAEQTEDNLGTPEDRVQEDVDIDDDEVIAKDGDVEFPAEDETIDAGEPVEDPVPIYGEEFVDEFEDFNVNILETTPDANVEEELIGKDGEPVEDPVPIYGEEFVDEFEDFNVNILETTPDANVEEEIIEETPVPDVVVEFDDTTEGEIIGKDETTPDTDVDGDVIAEDETTETEIVGKDETTPDTIVEEEEIIGKDETTPDTDVDGDVIAEDETTEEEIIGKDETTPDTDVEEEEIIGKDETTPDTIVEEELIGKDETTVEEESDSFPIVGLILCLSLLLVVALYFVIGLTLNAAVRGKRGKEIIPNFKFWAGLPSLLADGFKLIFCCKKKNPDDFFVAVPQEEEEGEVNSEKEEIVIDLNEDLQA